MKKLLTTMSAVAAAMSLFATDSGALSGTSFEGLTAGDALNINDNTGELVSNLVDNISYWRTNGTDTLTIKEGTSVGASDSEHRAAAFLQRFANNRYLNVKTASPTNSISRYVKAGGTAESINGGTDATKRLYFDSYIRFTAFDGDQTIDLGEGGKLAIWLKEEELEGGSMSTNLMITAGYLDTSSQAGAVVTNYNCVVDGGINFNDGGWHRVTVMAMDNIYASGTPKPGFVVFIDKTYARCTDTTTMGISGTLNGTADFYNSVKALFPSACQSGGARDNISAVDFAGQGDVDELVFTRTMPDFARDVGIFTIQVPNSLTGIERITFTTNDVTQEISATTTFTITDALHDDGIKIDVEYTDGYMAGAWLGGMTPDPDGYYHPENDGDTVQIVVSAAGASVNGKGFATLADAIAYVNDPTECEAGSGTYTVKLFADTGILTTGLQFTNTGITNVLDLAGKTITGAAQVEVIALAADVALTIVDSDENDGGTVTAGTDGYAVTTKSGSQLVITDGTFNGPFDLRKNTASLTAGSYSYADNTDGDEFALTDFVAAGKFAEHVDAYWVIGDAPTYTITFETGRADATVVPATTNYTVGGSAITLPTPVLNPGVLGVEFGGWTNETMTITTADMTYTPAAGDGNFTLYAKWDPVALTEYTITFDAGTGTVDPATTNYTMASDAITLPTAVPTGFGVTFGGWTNATYTTAIYAYTPAAGDDNFTLYAKWDAVAPCVITLVTGRNDATVDPSSINFWAGQPAITLPEPTLEQGVVGVTFGGWTNETITITTENMTYTPPAENAESFTLYAKWEMITPPTPTIEPGEGVITVEVAAESAEAAIAVVTVEPPAAGIDVAEYTALFNITATAVEGKPGYYDVAITGIKDTVVTGVDTSAVALLTSGSGTVAVPAGLYYKITPSTALPISGTAVQGLSTGSVEVTKPGTTQGFLKVELSVVPFSVPNS